MQGRTLDFDLNLSFFHSLLRFCFTCLFPELGHTSLSLAQPFSCAVDNCHAFSVTTSVFLAVVSQLALCLSKHCISSSSAKVFAPKPQFPFITTPDSRVEAVLKFDFRSFVRSCNGLHVRCLLQQLIFPFSDFLQDPSVMKLSCL